MALAVSLLLLRSIMVDAAAIDAGTAAIESVRIGFQGKYKVGHWVPLWIEFSGVPSTLTGKLEISMPDGQGQPVTYDYSDVTVDVGKSSTLCYVKFGRVQTGLHLAFVAADGTRIEREFASSEIPRALPTSKQFVVTLGNDVGVEQALVLRSRRTNESVEHAICATADELPDLWLGYAGVDLLVIPSRHEMWRQAINADQSEAIVKWLRFGGAAVFSCAEFCEDLIGETKPFASLVPGSFNGIGYERETASMEEFVGGERRVSFAEPDDSNQLPFANLSDVDGAVIFSEGLGANRHPAVVVGLIEVGQVIFCAFDLDSATLDNWSERPEMLRRLVEFALGDTEGDDRNRSGITQYGFDDIVGQMRMAIGAFKNVRVMPFSVVALLVATYVLFIGPVDYLFHQRFTKRFEHTWITFPVIVAAFCGIAYFMRAGQGGGGIQLNRVSVVDVDARTHDALGSSWWYLYSGENERLDLELDSVSDDGPVLDDRLMMWDGLAGSGFGGMDGGLTSQRPSDEYLIGIKRNGNRLETNIAGAPIDVRSSRSFYSQWTGKFDGLDNNSSLAVGSENQLEGSVVNSLPYDLEQCWLVHDRWVYQLGGFKAGQAKSLLGVIPSDPKRLLTGQKFNNGRYSMTPWNRDSTDIDEIMRMMMFYSEVRGESYTGLRHRYQSHVDCGLKLRYGRAMLVGASSKPPTKLMNSGKELAATQSTTYYRLSIPVEIKR